MLPARLALLIVLAVPVAFGAVLAPGAVAAVNVGLLAKPDLVVEQIFSQTEVLPAEGGSIIRNVIYVDVGNWGAADAAASELHFKLRDVTGRGADALGVPGQGYSGSGSVDLPAIPDGETTRVKIPVAAYMDGNPSPGAMGRYHMLAIADALNAVAETLETNNALEADVFGGEVQAS